LLFHLTDGWLSWTGESKPMKPGGSNGPQNGPQGTHPPRISLARRQPPATAMALRIAVAPGKQPARRGKATQAVSGDKDVDAPKKLGMNA